MSRGKKSGFGTYPLRYLALGLLMHGPDHGYQLDQTLGDVFGMIWKAGQTKLYVTLSALEEEGMLRIEKERQENRPDRKVYYLTEMGRQEFLEWVGKPVRSLRSARVELLAKLRFYDWLGLPKVEELIRSQQSIYQIMLDEWQADKGNETDPFLEQVFDFRIEQARFLINWLENYLSSLGRGDKAHSPD